MATILSTGTLNASASAFHRVIVIIRSDWSTIMTLRLTPCNQRQSGIEGATWDASQHRTPTLNAGRHWRPYLLARLVLVWHRILHVADDADHVCQCDIPGMVLLLFW